MAVQNDGKIVVAGYSDFGIALARYNNNINSGLNEIDNNNTELDIYPNPSNGKFIIDRGKIIMHGNVEIINAFGEKIYEQNFSDESKIEINISTAINGIYFVKVYDGKNYFSKKIVLVQN